MFCIVGLGNPGEKYRNNRHNVGFQFIDYLIENLQIPNFKTQKMLHVTCYMLHDLILAKPQTFMNRSGEAVKFCVTSYKLQATNDLVIVHDDLDIPLGKFKIQKGTGPKLHNGIESVERSLGTKDFWRVRVGVDARPARRSLDGCGTSEKWLDGETYVLNDFLPAEKNILMKEVFLKMFSRLQSSFLLH